jgi:putative endopeptidase
MLPISLSRAYLTRYDLSGLKKRITELCQDIIAAYREMLAGEDWLSESTKEKIIEKLDAITIHAVYPDKWIDHSSLNLEGLSYIDCLKAIARFERDLDRSHTNGRVDRELWNVDDLLEANAYYYLQENSINIIPGILNAPVYYEDMSQEALFGSLGSIIGHEISHAFDTKGAQFDKDGNLADWWQESDYAAFKIRADKLVARYDGITIWNGLQARGANIQTEAIADIAGIKCMLMIANRIPGFDYRAFFEAYASVLRSIDTPEREYSTATQNEHPVRYLRTNVTVQQFDEFHRTFGVQKGDRMYCAPEDRILVW